MAKMEVSTAKRAKHFNVISILILVKKFPKILPQALQGAILLAVRNPNGNCQHGCKTKLCSSFIHSL